MPTYMMKYNPSGIAPAGATQLKTLAIATGQVDVSTGGWYGGVNDDGVYLVTCDTTTLGFAGRSTGNGTGTAQSNLPTVWKTTDRSDSALIDLGNRLPGSPRNFSSAYSVSVWLDENNFGLQPTYTTTTTTTTTAPPLYLSYRSATSHPSDACSLVAETVCYIQGEYVRVFNDEFGSSPFNGGDQYWKIYRSIDGFTSSRQISSDGFIIGSGTLCI